jgi:hypothetical protein
VKQAKLVLAEYQALSSKEMEKYAALAAQQMSSTRRNNRLTTWAGIQVGISSPPSETNAVLSSHEPKTDSESYVDKMDMIEVKREHPRGHVLQVKQ